MEFISISLDAMNRRPAALQFLERQHAAVAPGNEASLEKEGRTTNNYIWSGESLDLLAEVIDPEWGGAMPHTLIIAPGGEVLWRFTGMVDPFELRRQLLRGLQ